MIYSAFLAIPIAIGTAVNLHFKYLIHASGTVALQIKGHILVAKLLELCCHFGAQLLLKEPGNFIRQYFYARHIIVMPNPHLPESKPLKKLLRTLYLLQFIQRD